MAGRLLRFLQPVTTSGYQWVGEGEQVLTDGVPVGHAREVRVYNALARAGLFREFAALGRYWTDTPALKEGVVGFANEYGLLGVEPQFIDLKGLMGFGEKLSDWTAAVRDLFLAVELLDNLTAKDTAALRRCIRWTDKGVHYVSSSLTVESTPAVAALIGADFPGAGWHKKAYDTCTPHGVILPARWLLQEWVNRALEGNVSGVLLWQGGSGQGQFALHYQPASLLAAMWCLLAKEVAANESERVCEYCGKDLPKAARKDKRFCDNVCRALYSRKRARF